MSRDSGINEIVTATLQAVAFQTCDLFAAMAEDGIVPSVIRVDGGMVANDWFLTFLADILGLPVERPTSLESTALGAAYLAGLQSGVYASIDEIAALWSSETAFKPCMPASKRDALYAGGKEAVAKVLS